MPWPGDRASGGAGRRFLFLFLDLDRRSSSYNSWFEFRVLLASGRMRG